MCPEITLTCASSIQLSGVYVTGIFITAFAFNIGFDVGVSKVWDRVNAGVRHYTVCPYLH